MSKSKCIVPNCNAGYLTCEEKHHLFSVPNNDELIKKWQLAIPRKDFVVKAGQVVCDKHFSLEDIVWKKEVKDPAGNVIASEDLKRPYLKPGSIPSIFPNCPSYLSKITKKRKSPKKRKAILTKKYKKMKIHESEETNALNYQEPSTSSDLMDIENPDFIKSDGSQNTQDGNLEDTQSRIIEDPQIHSHNEKEVAGFFNFIFSNKDSLSIPISWNRRQSNDGDFAAIELSKVVTRRIENKLLFVSSKTLTIYEDLRVEATVTGLNLKLDLLGFNNKYVSSTEEIENLVRRFNEVEVCSGCASPNSKKNFESSFALHDSEGRLRHVKCSIIVPDSIDSTEIRCKNCKGGRKVLNNKIVRLKKRGENKRILMNLSPKKKKKFEEMKRKFKNVSRQKGRFEQLYRHCKGELIKIQDKLSSLDDKDIADKLSKNKINKNELTVIHEILNASKCKSSKGRRYSDDWILLCLLFHMRSPAAYRLLRENKVLPLPCTSTIRRYLSHMDTPCGFDDAFLQLFSESLSQRPEIYRHGLLSIDEIATRKEVRLDRKSMKILGLTDYGDNQEMDVSEKADHGLVFMFQPIQGSFTQPIAVCVSKGPACGTTIAKLVVQAISVLEKAGAVMHGVIGDGSAPNRKFWSTMGVCGKMNKVKCWFPHPTASDRKVYVFSDTPHLMKCVRNRIYNNSVLKLDPKSEPVKWEYFNKLFEFDKFNITGKWCPKLTQDHLKLNSMLKMRVSLAVQILSNSVAKGLLHAKYVYPAEFSGCETTAEFCLIFNKLFDSLNRNEKGLELGCRDFEEMREFLDWLDTWEKKVISGALTIKDFLTSSTAEGLRVTVNSAIELSTVLLKFHGFNQVLTGNINQDPLERFFGTIRLAGGTNDHPTTPTFLQLYKILSAYSILKPPRLGNCTTSDVDPPQPLITISRLKELYRSTEKNCFEEIKTKLKVVVEDVHSDFSDFITSTEHDYASPELLDCLLFFTTESVCQYINKTVKCKVCLSSFMSTSDVATDTLFYSSGQMPKSFEKFISPHKELIHPNFQLYNFIIRIEMIFQKHCNVRNAFDLILNELSSSEIKINFNCEEHTSDSIEIISYIVKFYLNIRMREYLKKEMSGIKNKTSLLKKKQAKFYAS